MLTSNAGFHQRSTKITLLQTVRLRPDWSMRVNGQSRKYEITSAARFERYQNDCYILTVFDFAQCCFASILGHGAVI